MDIIFTICPFSPAIAANTKRRVKFSVKVQTTVVDDTKCPQTNLACPQGRVYYISIGAFKGYTRFIGFVINNLSGHVCSRRRWKIVYSCRAIVYVCVWLKILAAAKFRLSVLHVPSPYLLVVRPSIFEHSANITTREFARSCDIVVVVNTAEVSRKPYAAAVYARWNNRGRGTYYTGCTITVVDRRSSTLLWNINNIIEYKIGVRIHTCREQKRRAFRNENKRRLFRNPACAVLQLDLKIKRFYPTIRTYVSCVSDVGALRVNRRRVNSRI